MADFNVNVVGEKGAQKSLRDFFPQSQRIKLEQTLFGEKGGAFFEEKCYRRASAQKEISKLIFFARLLRRLYPS